MLTCVLILALTPMTTAEFVLVRPDAKAVEIRGDLWGWDKGAALSRGESGRWSLRTQVPANARVEYKFVVDGEWNLDPRAPKSPNGLGGENSVWTGPGYRARANTDPAALRQWGVSRTTLTDARGEAYQVVIARPAGVKPGSPVVIFNDGAGYETHVKALEQAANLVQSGQISKCVIVLVESPNRTRDYWQEPGPYLEFLRRRLLPWVRQSAGVVADRRRTTIGGASLGGLISIRAARQFPNDYGMVIAHSPSIWADQDLTDRASMRDYRAQTVLTWGTFEGMGEQVSAFEKAIPTEEHLRWRNERPEGHTWSLWREEFAPSLLRLLNNP